MYLDGVPAYLGEFRGGVKQTQILHAELIVTLYQAAPESVGRAKIHDRTTEDDDELPRRVEDPKEIRPMLDAPEALSDEHPGR